MQRRVHPVLVALVVVVVLIVVAMVYSRRLQSPPPIPVAAGGSQARRGMMRGGGGEGGGMRSGQQGRASSELSVRYRPSTSPRGFLVIDIEANSPLKVMGLQAGDVITSCNGETEHIRDVLTAALKALQEQGKPLTVVVERAGKKITFTRTEKLPRMAPSSGSPAAGARAGRGGGARQARVPG